MILALALLACRPPADSDGPADSDPIGPADCTGEPIAATCGPDAVDLPLDGARVEIPVTWRYDAVCGRSVADPVELRLEGPPLALQITVDAGNTGTYAEVALDGVPLVTFSERSEPPHRQDGGVASSVRWPDPSAEPLPDGECVVVRPIALTAASGGLSGRVLAAARSEEAGRIRVATYVVSGTEASDAELDAVLARVGELLEPTGLAVEEVHRGPVGWESPDVGIGSDRATLLAGIDAPDGALPLVFTEALSSSSGSVIGIAGGIPGGLGPGTGASGVFTALSWARGSAALDVESVASTTAHEIAHHLGLFHTSEADGLRHDALSDTPECVREDDDRDGDGVVGASECSDEEVRNLLFWSMVPGQSGWSPLQIESARTSMHAVP